MDRIVIKVESVDGVYQSALFFRSEDEAASFAQKTSSENPNVVWGLRAYEKSSGKRDAPMGPYFQKWQNGVKIYDESEKGA